MKWRLGRGVSQTLQGSAGSGVSCDHDLSPNLSFFIPSQMTPLGFKHFRLVGRAKEFKLHSMASVGWPRLPKSSLLPASPINSELPLTSFSHPWAHFPFGGQILGVSQYRLS